MQGLARHNPDAIENHLALAEAALAARLWGEARHHLTAAGAVPADAAAPSGTAGAPPRRLCVMMARLEEGERGDVAASRAWRDRALEAPADPAWLCRACGGESGEWQALCPHCGGFDTLDWDAPPVAPRPFLGPRAEDTALLVLPPATSRPDAAAPSDLAKTAQSDK